MIMMMVVMIIMKKRSQSINLLIIHVNKGTRSLQINHIFIRKYAAEVFFYYYLFEPTISVSDIER